MAAKSAGSNRERGPIIKAKHILAAQARLSGTFAETTSSLSTYADDVSIASFSRTYSSDAAAEQTSKLSSAELSEPSRGAASEVEPPAPAIPKAPENPQTFYDYLQCAYAHLTDRDQEAAWQDVMTALKIGSDEPDLLVPLCQQFPPRRRRQLATACMEQTSPLHPAFQWLWVEVAISFWFEGNFTEAAAEYEAMLQQKQLDPGLCAVIINGLAMSLEAQGRYAEAEARYLEAGSGESAVRARMHSGDYLGALSMLKLGLGVANPVVRQAMEGTISCLNGQPAEDLFQRLEALLNLEEDWPYKEFMAGVMQVVATGGQAGLEHFQKFMNICQSNPAEWGVTLRWEIKVIEDFYALLKEPPVN